MTLPRVISDAWRARAVSLALLGLLASCREPVGLPAAPNAESAVRVAGAARAVAPPTCESGAPICLTITGASIETRFWDGNSAPVVGQDANGYDLVEPITTSFDALPTGTPGYADGPILLASIGCGTVVAETYMYKYSDCVRNPGGRDHDLATRYTIRFVSQGFSSVSFRFGVDGLGAVLRTNGSTAAQAWNGPAWSGYITDVVVDVNGAPVPAVDPPFPYLLKSAEFGVLEASFAPTTGTQVVEVVSFENCCDYGALAQYSVDGGVSWHDVVVQAPQLALLTVETALPGGGSGGGTVTSVEAVPLINCGPACTASYDMIANPVVTLTASPAPGYVLAGWSGCSPLPGTSSCAVTMDAEKVVTAMFSGTASTQTMTVETRHWNSGGVQPTTSTAVSLFDGLPAVEGYTNEPVRVTHLVRNADLFTFPNVGAFREIATRYTVGMTFDGESQVLFRAVGDFQYGGLMLIDGTTLLAATWSPLGALEGSAVVSRGEHTISIIGFEDCCDASTGSVASFGYDFGTGMIFPVVTLPGPQNLTVLIPSGGGHVVSEPSGIDCGATCTATFAFASQATLTATADAGYVFAGWSGACAGSTSSTCVVRLQSGLAATATFARITHPLTVTVVGSGTVTSSPAGISCGSDCVEDYVENTPVTLTATPAAGSTFGGWSDGCSGTGSCATTVSTAVSVTATFTAIPGWDLTPPAVSCSVSPNRLWPVNHKMMNISATVSVTDAGSGPAGFKLRSVTSSEPINAKGDGNTSDDMQGWTVDSADVTGQFRAERSGNLRDRLYTLTYEGFDVAGNSATASCTVTVPHSNK